MNKLFTPISLLSGLLAGVVASKAFEFVWGRFTDQEAPGPDQRLVAWPRLIIAMLLEGAIARLTRGLIDRGTRVAFARSPAPGPARKPERK